MFFTNRGTPRPDSGTLVKADGVGWSTDNMPNVKADTRRKSMVGKGLGQINAAAASIGKRRRKRGR
jgi:hypothetical protein